jgi:hypothetical protein
VDLNRSLSRNQEADAIVLRSEGDIATVLEKRFGGQGLYHSSRSSERGFSYVFNHFFIIQAMHKCMLNANIADVTHKADTSLDICPPCHCP